LWVDAKIDAPQKGEPTMSKRRAPGEGSIVPDKKRPGRFTAYYTLENGKRKGHRCKTQKEAKDWLFEMNKARKENTSILDDSATVAKLVERYLNSVDFLDLEEITRIKYRALIHHHIIPEIGAVKLKALRAEHLDALYVKKLKGDLEKDIKPLKPRTVADIHVRLYTMLKLARKWGYVYRNVAEDVKPPSPNKEDEKFSVLTPKEADYFLTFSRSHRLDPLYAVAISMGLRRGEILGLRWEDIDFIEQRLRVTQQLQYVPHRGKITKTPKTKSGGRDLPIPTIAYDALIKLRERSMGTGFVFVTNNGTPFSGRNIDRDFENQLKKAGLPKIRFHDLRHTCASFLLAKGVNPKIVQELLGHKRVEITLQTYSHLLPGVDKEAVSKLDSIFTVPRVA
jgi:integrase